MMTEIEAESLMNTHYARIDLYEAVINYFQGPLGKALAERMDRDLKRITAGLLKADPSKEQEIRNLQQEYQVIERIHKYFEGIKIEGHVSLTTLEQVTRDI